MIGDDIRMKREQLGMSQEDVARAVGTTQQTIQRIEANKSPNSSYIPTILNHLGVRLEDSTSSETVAKTVARSVGIRPEHRYFYPLEWNQLSKTIKFRRSSVEKNNTQPQLDFGVIPILELGHLNGDWAILNKIPIDYIERGEPLLYAPEGYALKVVSNDMYPALKSSEIALVNPSLSPLSDEPHVFISSEGDNHMAQATIGYLEKATAEKWFIQKFNPKGNIDLFKDHFPLCHRIVGKFTRR